MTIVIKHNFAADADATPIAVVTHGGVFHADDVLAVCVLALAWGQVEVTRTRDRAALEAAVADPSVIVVDVGGVYDADANNFDHHQREGRPAPRPSGTPYAASGLVWEHHGFRAVRNVLPDFCPEDLLLVQEEVAKAVECVDALDCGYARPQQEEGKPLHWGRVGLSALVAMANPLSYFGEEDFDSHFGEAVEMVIPVLKRMILGEGSKLGLRKEVEAALKEADGKVYFTLQRGMPAPTWSNIASQAPESLLYAVFPMASGGWGVQQIPAAPGSFEGRKPLPEAWGGVRGEELQALLPETVPPGAVFCHPGRFIAGHETREGAIAMAEAAAAA